MRGEREPCACRFGRDALPRVRRRWSIKREQRTKRELRIRAGALSAKGNFGTCNGGALRPAAVVIFHANSQLTTNPSDQRKSTSETKISRFGK